MKKLVTPAMVLNAASRDVASGRTDAEDLVTAFVRAKGTRLPWHWRLGLKIMGGKEYRNGIRLAHRLLGTEAVEVEVKE